MDTAWISRWDLHFDDPATEDDFRSYHELASVPLIRNAMISAIVSWACIHAGIAAFARPHLLEATLFIGALYPVMAATVLVAGGPPTPRRRRLLQRVTVVSHLVSLTIPSAVGQVQMGFDALALAGVVALLYGVTTLFRHRMREVVVLLLAGGGMYMAALAFDESRGQLEANLRWGGPLFVAVVMFTCFTIARSNERALRESFLKDRLIETQRQQILAEKARSEALLLNVLPESIASVLRDRPGVIAEEQPEATVLFADLAGFTSMSSEMTAAEVVEMLNEVFTEFDGLVDKHGLEKIKTIGDCYMVAAGVPCARDDHATVTVLLALEMRDLVASRDFAGRKLSFRFGVNSGPVVAGVIGRRKFIYDLWGDTVNVASRMESRGHPGVVQISEETRARVAGAFVCEPRGRVDMKGKGEMDVFHVVEARPAWV